MKLIYSILGMSLLLMGCQPPQDNSANEAYEKNSKTVLANLAGFQNENQDYSQYAKDFVMVNTGFGAKDSLNLEELIEQEKQLWRVYDFKIINDPIILLPGVNADTKLLDGSVRHYTKWEITLSATDSTEAKSGVFQLYETYDFDAEGKIIFQSAYADFGGLFGYLHSPDSNE